MMAATSPWAVTSKSSSFQDERLLIVLNNCRYVREHVLTKLMDSFTNQGFRIGSELKKAKGLLCTTSRVMDTDCCALFLS